MLFTVRELGRILGMAAVGGNPDAVVASITVDSRAARPGALFVALPGKNVDGRAFVADALARGAVAVLTADDGAPLGSDVRAARFAVADPVAALCDLARVHRQRLRGRVIAVTGSNGKTTTKELVHWLLAWRLVGTRSPASFNNQLGVPLTLLGAATTDDYVVAEVGTNAPGEIAQLGAIVQPDVALVTCVGASHLAGLGTLEDVAVEKGALFTALRPGGIAVRNLGDPRVARMPVPRGVRTLDYVAADSEADAIASGAAVAVWVARTGLDGIELGVLGVPGIERVRVGLLGRHNAANVVAALAVARALEATPLVPPVWTSFRGLPMRMQVVERAEATYLNDAYNANPLSMGAALETLAELPAAGRIAVLGEMRELGDETLALHAAIGERAARLGLDGLVVVGGGATPIADAACAAGFDRARVRIARDVSAARSALDELMPATGQRLVLLKASRAVGLERLLA